MKKNATFLLLTGCPLLLRGAEDPHSLPLDINIDYSQDPIFQEVWFWGVVALFFLLLLVLLIRGGRRVEEQRQEVFSSRVEQESCHPGEQDQ
ncbi:MAG: hypothetical protein PHZ13_02110 [bacterium]|nr:hypothetical protein [bacterium]MDD3624556.1 hypothetical protein [Proteiniphilum sp.]MDD3967460.1 hypothetical protein [Proteiniphilum sp.]